MLIFTSGDFNDPSSRIRGYHISEALARHGIECDILPYVSEGGFQITRAINLLDDFLFKVSRVAYAKNKNPIVYIQRGTCSVPLVSLFFAILSKRVFKRKLIYDIDDGLFLSNGFEINNLIKLSDIVIVGGHELMDYAGKINQKTIFLPSSANIDEYNKNIARDEGKDLVLGFVGTSSTIGYLDLLLNPLERLVNKYDYTLKVIAARTDQEYAKMASFLEKLKRRKIKVEPVLYSVSGEAALLSNITIGLSPLLPGIWEKYKCGFKVINYMSASIPPVASNYGENKYIITDGYNGFLCAKEADWYAKLNILMDDGTLRKTISENARKTIERNYSLDIVVTKLIDVLRMI